jgi:hypothetical protein
MVQLQNGADIESVKLSAINADNLVLAGVGDAAVDRHHARIDRCSGGCGA